MELSWADKQFMEVLSEQIYNKMLGRALDPRANGTWLSKLIEWNMKCLSSFLEFSRSGPAM